ncbi:MAG: hypothetical protein HY721_05895 [Planctomycetes bacterium]|nr:hypothetical protein [Planctomycetota bacterium]
MLPDRRRPPSGPSRSVFLALAACLCLGCVVLEPIGVRLVPVGERAGGAARLRFSRRHAPYASGDVVFSHATEAHASLSCEDCHSGTTGEAESPGAVPEADRARVALPSMARCFTCHDGEAVTDDCIACHLTSRRDRKPAFHDGLFPRHHRRMAEDEAYKCSLCHVQGDCKSCHAERKPFSHTPRFERSTHGRLATHDRRACATCHETSFCESCHSQPPPDHTQAFRRDGGHRQAALIRGRSCTVCHRFEEVCAECHGG